MAKGVWQYAPTAEDDLFMSHLSLAACLARVLPAR